MKIKYEFADGAVSEVEVMVQFKRFLGYDRGEDGNLVLNEGQAAIVRRIYALFLQGRSPYAIAKLQKTYTVDFLTKKKKVNEGEIPQYYVENNHEAIIEPGIFDMVQRQMAVRHPGKNRQSSAGIFSSMIKCGCCGGWYGSKVWHSNDKYRSVVWQCNHKFDGGEKCITPHLDEDAIKELFVKAANILYTEKEEIIANFNAINERVFSTEALEEEKVQLKEEMNVVAELIQQCIKENACVAIDQEEYQKKYDGLAARFDRAKERLGEVSSVIMEKQAHREKIEMFLGELERMDGMVTEFKEKLWFSLVEFVTVHSKEKVVFTFKDGTEIEV
ncbi:MAG: recombinase family protein [Clostridiales bacterium]|nr:recombinase family protein [Clostridiales bacterium]